MADYSLLEQKMTMEYLTDEIVKKAGKNKKVLIEFIRKRSAEECYRILYYLSVLKKKGILRKGKLEFVEKNKKDKRIIYLELTDEVEKQLFDYIQEIEALIAEEKPPECIHKNTCKKCAYYEYCYI